MKSMLVSVKNKITIYPPKISKIWEYNKPYNVISINLLHVTVFWGVDDVICKT